MTESSIEILIKLYEDGKKLYIERGNLTMEKGLFSLNDNIKEWNIRSKETIEKFFQKKLFLFNNPVDIYDEIFGYRLKFIHNEIISILDNN